MWSFFLAFGLNVPIICFRILVTGTITTVKILFCSPGVRRSRINTYGPLRIVLVSGLLVLMAGCGLRGDFGRLRHQPPSQKQAFLGDFLAERRGELVSDYFWSDDERRLRSVAFGFLEPAGERGEVGALIGELRLARILPLRSPMSSPRHYYNSLKRPRLLSSATIWARLVDDVRTDSARLVLLSGIAFRVARSDQQRYDAYLETGRLEAGDVVDVPARISENRRLIAGVRLALLDRLNAYEYALEKARLEAPSSRELDVYYAILDLRRNLNTIEEILRLYDTDIA